MINPAFLQTLNIEKAILDTLKIVPHEWAKISGGAILFFQSLDGTKHLIAYHLPNLTNEDIAIFWEQVRQHPLAQETKLKVCLEKNKII